MVHAGDLPNMRCANCGTENHEDLHFCEQCGAALGQAPANPATPYYGPAGWAPYMAPVMSDKAVIAFILGIAGLIFCPFILSIPAIVLGKISQDEIRRSRGTLRGEGYATAGYILGIIGVAITILVVLVFAIGISLGRVH